MKRETTLIIGGAGFIASHLQAELTDRGIEDTAILDNYSRNSIKYSGLEPRVFIGDVRDAAFVDAVVKKTRPRVAYNFASLTGIELVEKSPVICIDTVVNGAKNVCESCTKNGVKNLIHASTTEVYGECHAETEDSDTSVGAAGDPRWSYASAKIAADHLVSAYSDHLDVCIARPANVFGPWQTGHGAISHFAVWALDGEPLKIYGDGTQIRAWCYAKDAAEAIATIHEAGATGIYNIGNPSTARTINRLAADIVKEAGSGSAVIHLPRRAVDVQHRVPNTDKIRKELGWKPRHRFRESLRETINWYRSIDYREEEWYSFFKENRST